MLLDTKGHHKVEKYSDDRVSKRKLLDDGSNILDAAQIDKKKDAAVTALTMGFAGTKGAMSRTQLAEFLAQHDDVGTQDNAEEVVDSSDEEGIRLQQKAEGGSARSQLFGFSKFVEARSSAGIASRGGGGGGGGGMLKKETTGASSGTTGSQSAVTGGGGGAKTGGVAKGAKFGKVAASKGAKTGKHDEKDIGHLDGRVERLRKSVLDEMTALEKHWDKVAEAISACNNGDADNHHEPSAAFLKAIKAAQTLCRDGAAKVKIQQAKLERSESSQNVFKDTADCLSKLAKQFIDVSLLCKSVSDPSSDSVELNATIASVDKHFADSQLDPQPSLSHTFRHIAVSRQALLFL